MFTVQVQKGPLGDILYPLYYRANIGNALVPGTDARGRLIVRLCTPGRPLLCGTDKLTGDTWGTAATGEVSDVQLEYLSPEALGLQPADLPRDKTSWWPQPRQHRWPFDGGLVRSHKQQVPI